MNNLSTGRIAAGVVGLAVVGVIAAAVGGLFNNGFTDGGIDVRNTACEELAAARQAVGAEFEARKLAAQTELDADKEKASKAITNAVVSFDKNGNPEIKEPWKCALDGSERDASNGAFQFAPEKDKVIFQIESWGQVAPREILSKAAQGLMEVNEEFAKLAKKELS